jgi:DNA N-6-adenine-methyltransferase (Dam)
MSAWEATGKSDMWRTPAYIFDAMDVEFDLDVAGIHGTFGNVPCHHALLRDSLETEWPESFFVWMNPPFGGRNGLKPWLDKFFAHGNGVALVPDRTSAPWFQEAARKASLILFVSPKIHFERPDGTAGKSPGCGTALMSIGEKGNVALCRAAHAGLGALMSPVS